MNTDISEFKKALMPVQLHYILKMDSDYIHQALNCASVYDMRNKAKLLEEKFGPMELDIRIKKSNLYISKIYNNGSTGVLFNPPLAKQIEKFKSIINSGEYLNEILYDSAIESCTEKILDDENLGETVNDK